MIKRLSACIREYKKQTILTPVCMVGEVVCECTIPLLTADLINSIQNGCDLRTILLYGLKLFVIAMLSLGFGALSGWFAAEAAAGFAKNLRHDLYYQVQSFSFANIDRFSTSSLVTRMTTDVTVIQNAFMNGFRPMMRGPVMFTAGLILASMLSVRLACVFFVMLPLLAVALVLIVRRVAPLYGILQDVMDQLNDVVQESVTAIRAVKAFVRDEWVGDRFGAVNGDLADTSTRTFGTAVFNLPLFQATMYTSDILILALGGTMIMAGELKVGELTGFMSYVLQITNSLMMISNVFLLMTRALTSARRVGEVLRESPTIASPENAIAEVPNGSIELRHASFKYNPDASADVLHDITLSFPAGSTVGVLGGTGSGKSSLVQLLPRLYDVTDGAVLIGGHDVREYDVAALRESVGIALQRPVLFSGTVRENLLWGRSNATDEELLEELRCKGYADPAAIRYAILETNGQLSVLPYAAQKPPTAQQMALFVAETDPPRVLVSDGEILEGNLRAVGRDRN